MKFVLLLFSGNQRARHPIESAVLAGVIRTWNGIKCAAQTS